MFPVASSGCPKPRLKIGSKNSQNLWFMGAGANPVQEFGGFRMDIGSRELLRDGRPVPLTPKAFDALLLLVQNRGRLVAKDELMQALWPDTFVAEANLTQTIFMLRKALGESASEHTFILTVPGYGYRFAAEAALAQELPPTAAAMSNALQAAASARRRRNLVAGVLALALAGVIGGGIWVLRFGRADVPPPRRQPTDPRVQQLYDNGRQQWTKRTPVGFTDAMRYFQQAIALDPNFAPAYSGLADTYALISVYDEAREDEYMPKARAAALKALELDPKLAEAHTSLALVYEQYDWDWKRAEEEYRRAIELDPQYFTAHHWFAECLAFEGKTDEALQEIQRARELAPASLIVKADRGVYLYFARRYDEAIEQFREVLNVEPHFMRGFFIVSVYMEAHRYAEGRAELQRWQQTIVEPWAQALQARIEAATGHPARARAKLARVETWYRLYQTDPMPLIGTYIALGEKDKALQYLEIAIEKHAPSVLQLKADPLFDPLRDDPRYHELLRRLHLE